MSSLDRPLELLELLEQLEASSNDCHWTRDGQKADFWFFVHANLQKCNMHACNNAYMSASDACHTKVYSINNPLRQWEIKVKAKISTFYEFKHIKITWNAFMHMQLPISTLDIIVNIIEHLCYAIDFRLHDYYFVMDFAIHSQVIKSSMINFRRRSENL